MVKTARSSAKFVAFTGILAAVALVLSLLESLLPPIPGMPPGFKVGLSNIVSMYAAGNLGLGPAMAIALTKGLFAFLTRGVTAGLMSTAGSLLSTLVLWLFLRKLGFGLTGSSAAGALAHNGAQLAVACVLTSEAVLFYVPFLALLGAATGALTGLALGILLPPLNRIVSQL